MKSIYHAARAGRITTPRARRKVAQALQRVVERTERRPYPHRLDSRVPVESSAVRACKDEVLSLADTLATIERPYARGVAIARQLVFDGRSPLYLQAPDRRKGADRRLASTLYEAQRALEVSAEFRLTQGVQVPVPRWRSGAPELLDGDCVAISQETVDSTQVLCDF